LWLLFRLLISEWLMTVRWFALSFFWLLCMLHIVIENSKSPD